jgi:hypothetical protein
MVSRLIAPALCETNGMALPGFGATPYETVRAFDKSAIASDYFFSVNSVAEKPGFATGESTWIERWMVRRLPEEVL